MNSEPMLWPASLATTIMPTTVSVALMSLAIELPIGVFAERCSRPNSGSVQKAAIVSPATAAKKAKNTGRYSASAPRANSHSKPVRSRSPPNDA
jgi:hypothetical protein